ncbi:restriction endonuclease subunit S [Niveispirillum sp. KHB5.9]|uniref:restriction endonuclease subunit S n=1 Tax=Niveispirillum sp. KHB5.9 TaxID=3400269 RepID=UPI003A8A62DA
MSGELPKGWAETTLGAITVPFDTIDPTRTPDKEFQYIDIGSIDNERLEIRSPKSFLGKDAPSRARRLVAKGDTLFATVRTYLKNIALAGDSHDGNLTSTGIAVLRPANGIEPKFLFRYVSSQPFVDAISQGMDGTMYPAINDGDLGPRPMPLPPEPEQHRIVAKIDSLFARSSRARDELAHIPKLIERYRQAVLEAAFRGDLTADLRNDREAFRNGELPSGWRLCSLGKLIEDGPQNGLYLPKSQYGDGVPILRIENYQDFTSDNLDGLKLVNVSNEDIEKYKLTPGDIVINRVNSPSHLGKSILIGKSYDGILFESNMMRFRVFSNYSPEYICLFLKSPEGKRRLTSGAKWAVNQASINQGDVTATNVPIPPIAEAKEIVKRIEHLLRGLQVLEVEFRSARNLIDRLDASILDKAFTGQLVPQDPNDEPASKLLDRICAARAAAPAVKRGRKAKGAADGGLF